MIKVLINNDIKYLSKDPLYVIVLILPLIIGVLYKYSVDNIELVSSYSYVLKYLIISSIPIMVGMLLGFRVLDEKDERVLCVYAVSPLGLSGYLGYRILQCLVLCIISIVITGCFGVVSMYNIIVSILIQLLIGLFIFLVISILGKNKIQGMTLSKLLGMVMILPVLQVVAKNKWDVIFKVIPTDFILTSTMTKGSTLGGVLYILELVIVNLLLIYYFYRRCINDI